MGIKNATYQTQISLGHEGKGFSQTHRHCRTGAGGEAYGVMFKAVRFKVELRREVVIE